MAMTYGYTSRTSVWRMNDWSSLFSAQRSLFKKENKIAKDMAKIGIIQRTEVQRLLVEAQLMWEAAVFYQQRAKDAHGAGNPILAQMLEARRLAYQYQRVTDEAQRIITEAQAMALAEREGAAMDRRRLRQEYAVRAMHFI